LCDGLGGALVWQGRNARVIRAQEEGFPAFYRVVWTAHVAEFSDLSAPSAPSAWMVAAVERVLRDRLRPTRSTWPPWAIWWPICTGT
jgi:diadenosine tetraphosphate (Ap4A) HIT family hydrolase